MRYGKSMSEALAEIREGFSKKEIKMAIGIASDPRYKQGNYSGAFKQIEKIKKGLASHPQVAAVLKRQNEEILEKVKCPECEGEGCPKCENNGYIADAVDKEDEPFLKDLIKNLRKGSATHGKQADDLEKAVKEETELDEGKMKALSMKIDSITAKMKKDKQMKSFADKFKKDAMKSMDIKKSLEKILPDYIAGKDIAALVKEETVVESWELDEMKMDDPKLLKIFDKLKKGSTVKIKIDSSISKGKDYREFTVTAKNIVGKGKRFEQEKITLKAKDNPTGVKHFLYNRDGKVTLAIGDMGASIADIKENRMSAYTAAITKGVK